MENIKSDSASSNIYTSVALLAFLMKENHALKGTRFVDYNSGNGEHRFCVLASSGFNIFFSYRVE